MAALHTGKPRHAVALVATILGSRRPGGSVEAARVPLPRIRGARAHGKLLRRGYLTHEVICPGNGLVDGREDGKCELLCAVLLLPSTTLCDCRWPCVAFTVREKPFANRLDLRKSDIGVAHNEL